MRGVDDYLERARQQFTQVRLAGHLGVSSRTIRRWEKGETRAPKTVIPALEKVLGKAAPAEGEFTFVDLFAGIGGIRLGFEQMGGHCVYTSEWDTFSRKTYVENFGDDHIAGDITKVEPKDIPDHDVLLAGFPCQPFSIAGVSKKNALGRPHGFECATQGTLFFNVEQIIAAKRPAAFLLENVKNLISHDKGKTFRVITETLRDVLGYHITWKVIDGRHWVPQHRERILIVGFREETDFDWDAMQLPEKGPLLKKILHPENGTEAADDIYTFGNKAEVHSKYTLTTRLWKYLQEYARKHREKGNGFGFGLVGPGDVARTLSARYYKDGSEILISRGNRRNPRRLTPRECARLMGFPDSFKIPVSDTQAYRQFGNSVVVPVMAETARIMKPYITGIKNGNSNLKQGSLFAA